VKTCAPWLTPEEAEARVVRTQAKLHQWAVSDHGRRFDGDPGRMPANAECR
jgi:hypothetical protein